MRLRSLSTFYFIFGDPGSLEFLNVCLNEFIKIKNLQNIATGTQSKKDVQSFVWCAGNKEDLLLIIELLKPKHYLNKENFNEFGIHI